MYQNKTLSEYIEYVRICEIKKKHTKIYQQISEYLKTQNRSDISEFQNLSEYNITEYINICQNISE